MSFSAPFFGITTGLEKSGAAGAANAASETGGFGAVEMLLITIGDCVCKKSCGQTFFRRRC
jgi:hypothetical protein